jgi:hypothetical protein
MEKKDLTLEDILAAEDLKPVPFEVPEWGGSIYFKVMSAKRAIKFREQMRSAAGGDTVVNIFAECACTADGNRLFADPDTLAKLKEKSFAVFLRAQDFLLKLNGMMRPDKSWTTVLEILQSAGVDSNVVALVKQKWDASDEAEVKND